MKIEVKNNVAVVSQPEMMENMQSALDFIAAVRSEAGLDAVIVPKEAFTEDFYRLSSHLAGEILQKFINYGMKLAVVGDFSVYTSKNMKDFLYESNQGNTICFLPTEEEALARLAKKP